VNILLPGDVAHDAVGSREILYDMVDALACARDKGNTGAAPTQFADECEAQARRATGDGHSQ